VTAGFVQALFGADQGFKVSLDAEGSGEIETTLPPSLGLNGDGNYWDMAPTGTLHFTMPERFRAATEDTEVNIDLQSCVAGNMDLMQQAWKPVVGLSEQFMEGHCTGAVRSLCTSLWTVVLTDVQQSLRTCGFSSEQEAILIHSLWAGDLLHANLSMPTGRASTRNVTTTLANAVESWHAEHYTRFGKDMGELVRDLVVTSFPEKFALDEQGRVHAMLEESQTTWRASPTLFGSFAMMSCGLVSLVAGLVVTRVQRGYTAAAMLDRQLFDDLEAGTEELE